MISQARAGISEDPNCSSLGSLFNACDENDLRRHYTGEGETIDIVHAAYFGRYLRSGRMR